MKKLLLTSALLVLYAGNSYAAVAVDNISATPVHGDSLTVTGSGFTSKSTAAPTVWDDCSGTVITDKWSGAWPNLGTVGYRTHYTTPINSVGLPHSHITKYMAGAHTDSSGYNSGYNVMAYKAITVSLPQRIYGYFWHRADPNWDESIDNTDNNFKYLDYSNGSEPYTMNGPTDSNWYVAYGTDDAFTSSTPQTVINDDGGSLDNPDQNSHNFWWLDSGTNLQNQWIKREFEYYLTSSNDGYIKVWESGVQVVNYLGPTDQYTGTTKTIGFGGYVRDQAGSNQWQYFADLYLDVTAHRVEICTGSTWATKGLCAIQPPTAWSTTSVTVTVNQDTFANSASAYLYVVDSTGAANANGKAITFGSGGGDTTAPTTTISTTDPSSISSDALTVTGSASDAVGVSGCKWRLTSAPDSTHGTECTGSTSFSCSTSGYSSGSNTMHVACYDAAGNYGDDSLVVNYTPATTVSLGTVLLGR